MTSAERIFCYFYLVTFTALVAFSSPFGKLQGHLGAMPVSMTRDSNAAVAMNVVRKADTRGLVIAYQDQG